MSRTPAIKTQSFSKTAYSLHCTKLRLIRDLARAKDRKLRLNTRCRLDWDPRQVCPCTSSLLFAPTRTYHQWALLCHLKVCSAYHLPCLHSRRCCWMQFYLCPRATCEPFLSLRLPCAMPLALASFSFKLSFAVARSRFKGDPDCRPHCQSVAASFPRCCLHSWQEDLYLSAN